ncbi:LysR family transcriptional regulator [Zestomonas carbonaria]|uniref:PCP degradation transcriptional activation protein n=1 Tax=Zestomonas carbonaria TaxID=2762745 RepID=A0A7U7EP80_9GAMM|nr:LysR family transcriptional regulator [Pseudomonas carbonaria]CAD5108223.1 PCP degradation transcriptional activation protein [Pseudomonas carbonaria]
MNKTHEWPALHRLDLNLFRVFEVIYRERNLTRAAAALHLSQSAVSHALGRLRGQLGDPLFVRDGRGVAPTPLAEQLAPGILDALDSLQRSVGRLQAFDPQRDRRAFVLNMPEQMEPVVLPAILAQLRRIAPRLEVRSSSVHWAELKLELIAGRVDLAIEIARPTDAELRQQLLLRDPLCVVAGPGFSGELTVERYLAAEHVAVTSRRRGICVEDLALGHLGLVRQVRQHCQHYLTAAQLVAQSGMLLTMPRRYARLLNAGLGNRLLEMPLELPPVTLNLYWSRQAEHEPGNRWLRGQLLELGRGEGGLVVPS